MILISKLELERFREEEYENINRRRQLISDFSGESSTGKDSDKEIEIEAGEMNPNQSPKTLNVSNLILDTEYFEAVSGQQDNYHASDQSMEYLKTQSEHKRKFFKELEDRGLLLHKEDQKRKKLDY